jgi:hypothetical protein
MPTDFVDSEDYPRASLDMPSRFIFLTRSNDVSGQQRRGSIVLPLGPLVRHLSVLTRTLGAELSAVGPRRAPSCSSFFLLPPQRISASEALFKSRRGAERPPTRHPHRRATVTCAWDQKIGVGDIIMSRSNDVTIDVRPGRAGGRVDQVRNGNPGGSPRSTRIPIALPPNDSPTKPATTGLAMPRTLAALTAHFDLKTSASSSRSPRSGHLSLRSVRGPAE